MEKLLVVGGGTIFHKYILRLRKQNKAKGIFKKTVRKRNASGEVFWEREYYYKKERLPEHEIFLLKQQGEDDVNKYYKETYLGSEKPEGFDEDVFSVLKEQGKVEIQGKELVTTEETFNELCKIEPSLKACKRYSIS